MLHYFKLRQPLSSGLNSVEPTNNPHSAALLAFRAGRLSRFDEIVETADTLRDAKYFMVKNFINDSYYFGWDEATHGSYFKIPCL